jgi:hypothetical protein
MQTSDEPQSLSVIGMPGRRVPAEYARLAMRRGTARMAHRTTCSVLLRRAGPHSGRDGGGS